MNPIFRPAIAACALICFGCASPKAPTPSVITTTKIPINAQAEKTHPPIANKQQDALEGKKSENELSDLENRLRDIGVNPGMSLWLKYPKDKFPGLTHVTVESIKIYANTYGTKNIYLIVSTEDGGKSAIELGRASESNSAIRYSIESAFFTESTRKGFSTWSKKAVNAIANGKIFLGMTSDQVRASWGRASKINETTGRWGVHEQWVYGDIAHRSYLYFQNGRLTAWQD